MDFTFTKTFKVDECSVCGSGKTEVFQKKELIIEELCGRDKGKRTFSITPTNIFQLNTGKISNIAKDSGFKVENLGDLGLSLRTNEISISFMKRGSAIIVGTKDEKDAVSLYKNLLGLKATLAR